MWSFGDFKKKNKPFSTYHGCFWSFLVTFGQVAGVLIQFNFNFLVRGQLREVLEESEVVKKTVPEEKVILESQVLL